MTAEGTGGAPYLLPSDVILKSFFWFFSNKTEMSHYCLIPRTPLRRFLCNFCGTGFKRRDTLKQHLATHAQEMMEEEAKRGGGEVEGGVQLPTCNLCKKVCRNGTALAEHMAKAHSEHRKGF
jgi:hypothetical protein